VSDKVLSPVWQALSQLHADVSRDLDLVVGALGDADRRMAGGQGDVWVGDAAVRWGTDLAGAARDAARRARAFEAYVRRELAGRAREVTAAQADNEMRQLTGRLPR
jgi:hypothetical protein